MCETIVTHISEVTFSQKEITRMVLNFKVDSRDKIWLITARPSTERHDGCQCGHCSSTGLNVPTKATRKL